MVIIATDIPMLDSISQLSHSWEQQQKYSKVVQQPRFLKSGFRLADFHCLEFAPCFFSFIMQNYPAGCHHQLDGML